MSDGHDHDERQRLSADYLQTRGRGDTQASSGCRLTQSIVRLVGCRSGTCGAGFGKGWDGDEHAGLVHLDGAAAVELQKGRRLLVEHRGEVAEQVVVLVLHVVLHDRGVVLHAALHLTQTHTHADLLRLQRYRVHLLRDVNTTGIALHRIALQVCHTSK